MTNTYDLLNDLLIEKKLKDATSKGSISTHLAKTKGSSNFVPKNYNGWRFNNID